MLEDALQSAIKCDKTVKTKIIKDSLTFRKTQYETES